MAKWYGFMYLSVADWMLKYNVTSTQINTHQYSATHFERDLTHGQNEKDNGMHVSHSSAGVPGKYPFLAAYTQQL